ncbi:MAG: 1-acyl-sn-glycerol-3-phosphate acyltransferase [Burkholderiaceae bacterium]
MTATSGQHPARGPLSWLARSLLKLAGWRVDFAPLPEPRGIILVYPHTSNWDFIIGLLAKWALGIPFRFVGKESLFRGLTGATLGRLIRAWGGMPVNRHDPQGAVGQITAMMQAQPWCWLAMAPEGTRSHRATIRSGFYFLALQADLPVGLCFFDFKRKLVACPRFVRMSGDIPQDLALLREFYQDKPGFKPHNASTIAFREH